MEQGEDGGDQANEAIGGHAAADEVAHALDV
jgi:hypothetical protein